MTDTPIDMGMVSDTTPPSTPAPTASPQLRPSAPPNPRSVGFSPARDRYEQTRSTNPQGAAPGAATELDGSLARPDGNNAPSDSATPAASQEKFKVGKFEVSEVEIGDMLTRQAQDDLRKATLPSTPDAYELKLPEGTKLPGDIAVQFNAKDPGMIAARNWAHAHGLDQQGFSEVLSIYAAHVAQQEATLAGLRQAEIAKLGATGPQRVDAIAQWLRAEVGDADANPILATLATAAHVRMFEKIMGKLSSQGAASFSQQHRATPESNRIPGYETMSFEQRRYAQDQIAARRR